MPDPTIPAGHSLMPDDERRKTLAMLQKSQSEMLAELQSLPVSKDTLRVKQRKELLERKLQEVETAITMFSRPRVFVRDELLNCELAHETPSGNLFPSTLPKNEYIFKELDEETLSFLEDTRNEIIEQSSSAKQERKKRRIYSSAHLDPKKSGRRFRANDRERRRMESLNGALDALKGCIPLPSSKKRMTKLHILRQACEYIQSLTEVLDAAAVELGDSMDGSSDRRSISVINGLSISQRLGLLSCSGMLYHHSRRETMHN
eukprot:gene12016-13256_t